MNSNARSLLACGLAITLASAAELRAQQDKDTSDADISKLMDMTNQMQKQADDMAKHAADPQKGMPSVTPRRKKTMAELQAIARERSAQMEQRERLEKQKTALALKKQLDAPGPVALPDWTPKSPEVKTDGPATRKIIDDQVYTVVTGTSTLTPAQLGDVWEKEKPEKTSIGRSNNIINDLKQVIIYIHPQDDFDREVRLEAERKGGEKVTRVKISSPMPEPDVDAE